MSRWMRRHQLQWWMLTSSGSWFIPVLFLERYCCCWNHSEHDLDAEHLIAAACPAASLASASVRTSPHSLHASCAITPLSSSPPLHAICSITRFSLRVFIRHLCDSARMRASLSPPPLRASCLYKPGACAAASVAASV